MPIPVIVEDTPGLRARLISIISSDVRDAFAQRSRCALGLCGGSVATTFFAPLAQARVDWPRADFFWIDERAVPPSSPESNYGLARSLWLLPAGVPDARIHRMPADAPALDAAARGYAADLERTLGDPPRLDVALVGVGPDGHVASLFPGHALLGEETRTVAALEDAPKPPPRRLTLTLATLGRARHVVVIALGDGKAAVIREAIEDGASGLPVSRLVHSAEKVTVLLDPPAAGLLRGAPRG